MAIDKHTNFVLDGSSATFTDRTITGILQGVANVTAAIAASGTFTFSANPANADTVTIGGTAITFETSGATGNQVNIGATDTITIASLLALLQASADTNLVKFTYSVTGLVLTCTAVTPGTGGNSLTIAKSSTAIAVSGATLASGATGAGNTVSTVVTFAEPLPANYGVWIGHHQDATGYISTPTTSGFTVVLSPRLAANALAAGTFDVLVLA